MKKGISRRDFLKGSAAVAAAGLLGACTANSESSQDTQQTEQQPEAPKTLKWNEAPEKIAEDQIKETLQTEVLVVGAGGAGLMAAAGAAEEGAKVVLLEALMFNGTERHWIGAVDTKSAKEANVDFDKKELVEELMRYASCRADQKLIQLWADESGNAIDWLADLVAEKVPGTNLHMEWDIGAGSHGSYKIFPTMHNFQNDETKETVDYFPSLIEKCQELGVEMRYETPMVQLERADDNTGRVTGAIAKGKDGYIRINASKGVILCTGGYSSNKEMMEELNPTAYKSITGTDSHAFNNGDGIKAAVWVGAAKDDDATCMLFDRGAIQPDHFVDGNWEDSGYLIFGSHPFLKVNLKGERFVNESLPYDFMLHAGSLQPKRLYNTIFDANWHQHVTQMHQIGCARIEPSESGGLLQIFNHESAEGLLQGLIAGGYVQQADTLEELAEKLNIPAEQFVATVNRYNELAAKGNDDDFGKEGYRMIALDTAPFYGARQGATLLCTLDGLRVNTSMQVLDNEGEVIEGLYAAGNDSGGFFAHNYPEYIVGVAIGRTLTFGRIAGKAAAKA